MQKNQHSETWPGLPGTPEARNSAANTKTTILASLVWALTIVNLLGQPTLDTQPADQTNLLGSDATFCVTASGTPPLSYQWRDYSNAQNFVSIPGATNACLTVTNIQPTIHRFAVVVSNPSGSVMSRLARLTVQVPPIITNQPTDQVIGLGESYTNRVVVGGDSPLGFQWYFVADGTTNLLAGKTANPLILSNVQFINSGGYFVTVTNRVGTNISQVATMQVVTMPPAIVVQPANATVEVGQAYTNGVVASGTAPLSYQWLFNGQPLTGKTNSTISIPNIQSTNEGCYSVMITNPYGVVTSRCATLFFGPGATFTKVTSGPIAEDRNTVWGLAWGDYDSDGYVDLFAGSDPGSLANQNWLYHNQGDGTFTHVANGPGVGEMGQFGGAAWADFNNDGWLDLFVPDAVRWYTPSATPNHLLYRGIGAGQFTKITQDPAVAVPSMGWDPIWGDFDNDGHVDLFITAAWQEGRNTKNYLFHNTGLGGFTQVMNGPVVNDIADAEMAGASDFDNDGDLDLLVSCHFRRLLYRNNGDGTFTSITNGPIVNDTGNSAGIAWGDYDNDGLMDLCLATYDAQLHLFRQEANGQFTRTLLGEPSNYHVPNWVDFDNDGHLDLFVSHGNGIGQHRNRLYRNNGDATFSELRSVIVANEGGYSATEAWADYDNNGFADLVVANGYQVNGGMFMYRNDGNTNHWLSVRLRGTASNRSAIGAKVRVLATVAGETFWQMREITGSSCRSQGDPRALFGLGDAIRVETLRVEWPSGRTTQIDNVAAGQILTITEPTNDLPSIVTQPADHTNLLGSDATFCVTATGTPPLSYQWRDYTNAQNFADIPDATNACLTVTNIQPTIHRFAVVVSNPSGSVMSRLARLTVQVPPIITNQPTDQVVGLGENYTNSVGVGGDAPLSYQWYFVTGGTTNLLAGKTANPLILSNVQFTNSGGYFVVVTNRVGTNVSLVAMMQVITLPPAIVVQPASATVEAGQTYTNGVVASGTAPLSYQWFFNDQPLTGKTTSTITIPNIQSTNAGCYSVMITNPYGRVTSWCAKLFFGPGATFTRVTGAPWDTDLGTSGGVAGDYNGDGFPDLFISRYRSGRGALYHNNGDGTFRSLTNSNFPFPVGDYGFGACSDYDNDGRADLFTLNWAGNSSLFYFGNGDGTFTPAPFPSVSPWSQHAVDYDRDGFLDLFLTSWPPSAANTNRLYHNLGGRNFQAMTSGAVGAVLGVSSFGNAAFVDYNDDGWEDLATADLNTSRCFLYRNTGAGRFVSATNQITQASIRALVVNWGDYDNDGRVDLGVAAFGGQSAVFRNLGGGNFERASIGLTIQGNYNGASWGDYDNDGFLDLLMTSGNNGRNSLYRNNGDGTFSALLLGPVVNDSVGSGASYAGLWFDYDKDGFLDLFVPNGNDAGTAVVPNFLYHNDGNTNAWLKVKLVGTASNRDAAGAKVRVKATFGGATRWQRRDITSGGDPYSGNGPIAHFGLRDATSVETLKVDWPSGRVTEMTNVATRQTLSLAEPPGLTPAGMTNGMFQFDLIAHADQSHQVFTSSNLTDWVPWLTVTNTSRTNRISDPVSTAPHRFYKATPAP